MGLISLIGLIDIKGLLCYNEVHPLQSGRLLKWSLKSGVLNVGFKITSRVQIKNTNKLLFTLTNDCKKGIIAFLDLFDLFEDPLIIPISCDNFQHGGGKSLKTIINVDPESLQIAVFSNTSAGGAI